MLEGKALVEDTDMPLKMQIQATSSASQALDLYDVVDCKSIAAHIKKVQSLMKFIPFLEFLFCGVERFVILLWYGRILTGNMEMDGSVWWDLTLAVSLLIQKELSSILLSRLSTSLSSKGLLLLLLNNNKKKVRIFNVFFSLCSFRVELGLLV